MTLPVNVPEEGSRNSHHCVDVSKCSCRLQSDVSDVSESESEYRYYRDTTKVCGIVGSKCSMGPTQLSFNSK